MVWYGMVWRQFRQKCVFGFLLIETSPLVKRAGHFKSIKFVIVAHHQKSGVGGGEGGAR